MRAAAISAANAFALIATNEEPRANAQRHCNRNEEGSFQFHARPITLDSARERKCNRGATHLSVA